jgi:hypothetical protein
MPISKMSRDGNASLAPMEEEEANIFDFGEPEVISVELSSGKFLTLKEPSASDLIEISKISDNKSISEVEATLQTICILHSPAPGGRRLTLKDAKRLTAKQLRKLGEAINLLLGLNEEAEEE